MPKPPVRFFEATMNEPFVLPDGREVTIRIKGLLNIWDSLKEEWYSFAWRAYCQGPDCTRYVDTPMTKRPGPHSRYQATMYLAAQDLQPRGCIVHPPETWV